MTVLNFLGQGKVTFGVFCMRERDIFNTFGGTKVTFDALNFNVIRLPL